MIPTKSLHRKWLNHQTSIHPFVGQQKLDRRTCHKRFPTSPQMKPPPKPTCFRGFFNDKSPGFDLRWPKPVIFHGFAGSWYLKPCKVPNFLQDSTTQGLSGGEFYCKERLGEFRKTRGILQRFATPLFFFNEQKKKMTKDPEFHGWIKDGSSGNRKFKTAKVVRNQ